jgi:hypothetical protein
MSEAARDIQRILTGEEVKPNEAANVAYKQKLVNYLRDQAEHMKPEQVESLIAYIKALEPYVIRNTVRKASAMNAKAGQLEAMQHADLDQEARRTGITRQAFIKVRLADALVKTGQWLG